MGIKGQSGADAEAYPVNPLSLLPDFNEEVDREKAAQAKKAVHPGLSRIPYMEGRDGCQRRGQESNLGAEQFST